MASIKTLEIHEALRGWNQKLIDPFLWLCIVSFFIEQARANICKTQELKLTEKAKAGGETCATQEAKIQRCSYRMQVWEPLW